MAGNAMGTASQGRARTLFDKVFDPHVVTEDGNGQSLLWIDRHLLHEGSHHAFNKLKERGAQVRRPDLTFGIEDHYVPTRTHDLTQVDPAIREMIERLRGNTSHHKLKLFGLDDPAQGIVHVVGPEQGLTLPGLTIVCGDSHTATHGAFGAIAFGHRRLGSRPCADDADPVAAKAETDAHQRRGGAGAGGFRQGHRPGPSSPRSAPTEPPVMRSNTRAAR